VRDSSGADGKGRQRVFGKAHAFWEGNAETVDECGLGGIWLGDTTQPDLTEGGGRQHDVVGLDARELFKDGAR
jgi:hypothetical protein